MRREKQLLIDLLCSAAGGPLLYTGRDMKTSHQGMRISAGDWSVFMEHVTATLTQLEVPQPQRGEVTSFIESIKAEIAES